MKRRVKRKTFSKERIIMAASSVIVLSALTATGIWINSENTVKDEGYVVDLSSIESESKTQVTEQITEQTVPADDLDYDPYFQETNSGKVENPDESESKSMSEGAKETQLESAILSETAGETTAAEAVTEKEDAPAISTAMQPTLDFSDNDTLVWPIVGNILVNYSMDKTIYFPTLDQYKYNPAMIIGAAENDQIIAGASGLVKSIDNSAQTGITVNIDLGNGYEAFYGQLQNVAVKTGDYVEAATTLGYVAEPTKYYSVEGANLYIKMTENGNPVDPLEHLNYE